MTESVVLRGTEKKKTQTYEFLVTLSTLQFLHQPIKNHSG